MSRGYRELVQKHLSRRWERLFADFIGLHFHVAWNSAAPKDWDAPRLPSGRSACCRLRGSTLLPQCRTCGRHQLRATLESECDHRFTCQLGVRNCWVPIRVRNEILGIAYLQALDHAARRFPGGMGSAQTAAGQSARGEAFVLDRLKFARAARLLQQIIGHVQTASLSDLRKAELTNAARSVVALEREQARLREALRRYLPEAPAVPPTPGPTSHTEQLVRGLLGRVQSGYAKPLRLRELARELGLNSAYVSTVFSRVVGVPFKTYLTGLRMQKAKELLGDLFRTASEVAFAVGYSSEERFRRAFKRATGLSPRAWRETMPAKPL